MNKTSPRKAGRVQAISLLLPCTLAVMGTVVLAPVLPMLQDHFKNVPGAEYLVPMILTTPAMVLVLFSPFAGFVADLFGRRNLLLAAMLLYSAVGVAPLFLDSLKSILMSRVGVGMVEAVILTVSTTLIGDFFKGGERDKWLAYQTAIASISAVCFIFVGGLLGTFGWRGPFALYASAAILMFGVMRFTWEPDPDVPPAGQNTKAFLTGFPLAHMAGICAITLFVSIMFFVVQLELPFGLRADGIVNSVQIGALTAVASIFVPVGSFIFMRLSRHLGVGSLLLVELVILAIGFVCMGRAPNYRFLIAAASLNQIGAGMSFPTLLAWALRDLPYEWRGRGTGMWQGTNATGQFLSPLIVTFVSAQMGGILNAFIVMGVCCSAGALIALWALLKRVGPGTKNTGLSRVP
jgi:MFS family permease